MLLFSLTEIDEKMRATIILRNFVNKPYEALTGLQFSKNLFHWSKLKASSQHMILINRSRYFLFEI